VVGRGLGTAKFAIGGFTSQMIQVTNINPYNVYHKTLFTAKTVNHKCPVTVASIFLVLGRCHKLRK
jgi:hypothetical protein